MVPNFCPIRATPPQRQLLEHPKRDARHEAPVRKRGRRQTVGAAAAVHVQVHAVAAMRRRRAARVAQGCQAGKCKRQTALHMLQRSGAIPAPPAAAAAAATAASAAAAPAAVAAAARSSAEPPGAVRRRA
eukprot:362556-Chlamydomonas_euryale.AAC.3